MSTTAIDTPATATSTSTAVDATTTWRDVLTGAATGQLVMAAFMLAITVAFEHRFDPMPVVTGVIIGGGVVLLRRRPTGRVGVVWAAVVSLLLLLMVTAFGGLTVFVRPESTFELILFGGLLVTTVLGVVAAPGAWRRSSGPAAAIAPKVVGAYLVLLVVVGIAAGALTGSASRMPGDLTLRAKDFAFSAETLDADAGRVSIWIDNDDVSHHDFTIKDVGSQELPAQKASRAAFDLQAGTYRFYCSLHPDMEGTLRVS